jgi:hypothetical protein
LSLVQSPLSVNLWLHHKSSHKSYICKFSFFSP